MNQDSLLPVSAVAEYLFCPRNLYYRLVEGVVDEKYHLIEGKVQDELREARERVRRDSVAQIRRVTISSAEYGIIGTLDMLEQKEGEIYPVEYKKGSLKSSLNDDVQVCCQGILLEEELGIEVVKGYIYYVASAARREVYLSDDLRQFTIDTIEKTRELITEAVLPEPVNDKRCGGCSLHSRCLPQETVYLREKKERPKAIMPSAALNRVLYVDTAGAYLRKREGCVYVTKDNETLKQVPINSIDQVVMFGQINATAPLLDELLKRQIPTFFYSNNGQLSGWLQPSYGKNSLLRINQIRRHDDNNFKKTLARQLIRGKISNARTLVMRYNRAIDDVSVARHCDILKQYIKKLDKAETIDELLGIEGISARQYFAALTCIIKPASGFILAGRNRRPPRDPVNALLSLGYAILLKDIISEINRIGLDPYIGFMHSIVYGRPALALDLMEEFRPVIVDSAVLTVINKAMITNNDFDMGGGECKITEKGRKAFIQAYRNRINDEIKHPIFGYKLTYRRTIELQVRMLAKLIQGELKEYTPFMVR